MCIELRHMGTVVNKKLVYKLMKQQGLASKIRRRRRYNSFKGHSSNIAENLLNREFDVDQPNQKWVSDVTEFRVATAKSIYLRLWTCVTVGL